VEGSPAVCSDGQSWMDDGRRPLREAGSTLDWLSRTLPLIQQSCRACVYRSTPQVR
jgi:hypothetical protein